MRYRVAFLAAALSVIGVVVATVVLTRNDPREEFCDAYGVIVTSESRDFGSYTLLAIEPATSRDPCQGDDLWHYMDEDLADVDGVLFDDCVISWVDGGRSTASEAGVQCTPAT